MIESFISCDRAFRHYGHCFPAAQSKVFGHGLRGESLGCTNAVLSEKHFNETAHPVRAHFRARWQPLIPAGNETIAFFHQRLRIGRLRQNETARSLCLFLFLDLQRRHSVLVRCEGSSAVTVFRAEYFRVQRRPCPLIGIAVSQFNHLFSSFCCLCVHLILLLAAWSSALDCPLPLSLKSEYMLLETVSIEKYRKILKN